MTYESEWDDTRRARAEALTYLEDTTCGGCGGDLNRTLEPVHHYDVDTETVCYSCRAKQLIEREDRRDHEKDAVRPGQPKHDEGRIYTVREMTEQEVESYAR